MAYLIRTLAAAGLCLAIAGCSTTTAEMMAKPGGVDGPTSGPDFGLVRYIAGGNPSDLDAREQDANRQMSAACSGHYRVIAKGPRSQLEVSSFGRFGRNVQADTQEYIYIRFSCTGA